MLVTYFFRYFNSVFLLDQDEISAKYDNQLLVSAVMPFLSCMQACKRSVLVLETFSFSTEPHLNSMAAPKP